MKIFILVQESQSDHGYIDTSILDAYTEERLAQRALTERQDDDLAAGEAVHSREDDWAAYGITTNEADWTVNYLITETTLYRAPRTSVESQVYIDTGELKVLEEQ